MGVHVGGLYFGVIHISSGSTAWAPCVPVALIVERVVVRIARMVVRPVLGADRISGLVVGDDVKRQ